MRTAILTTLACAALVIAEPSSAGAQTDFHWNGQMAPGQTLEVDGVNGDIQASASSTGGAEVVATKSARFSDPQAVRIEVVPHAGGVTICAVYPDVDGQEPNRCEPGSNHRMHTRNNDTVVKFQVHVPAGVRFVGRTVNGGIQAEGLDADAEAHTVNGSVRLATKGSGLATTVNGSLDVTVGRAQWTGGAKFSTVNGAITLAVPAGLSADISASTVNGSIKTDFPITVTGTFSRRKLQGTIGGGGQQLALSTVNGSITLTKAQ